MSNLIGQPLGRYEIKLKMGEGGMAEVYQAYDPLLDRQVAIKVLPRQWAEEPSFIARFRSEAQAIAKLDHPNILPIFDAENDDRYSYLVMKLIPNGQTLRWKINQGLSIWQSLDIVHQVGEALQYTHDHGVIHKDVKPSNVLMDGDRPLLSDFGLAESANLGSLTQPKYLQGTAEFMAPEQFRGTEVDHRADLYALALILYELLTGKIPHKADDFNTIAAKRTKETPPRPGQYNPNIPTHIERALLKALATRPDDRFETVDHFLNALEPWPKVKVDYDTMIPVLPASISENSKKRAAPFWYGGVIAFIILIGSLPLVQPLLINSRTTPKEEEVTKSEPFPATSEANTALLSEPLSTAISSGTATFSATTIFEPAPIFFEARPNEITLGEEVRLQWDAGKNVNTVQLDVIPHQLRQSEGTYLYKPNRTGNITITLTGEHLQTGVPFTETVTVRVKSPTSTPTSTATQTATPSRTPTVLSTFTPPPIVLSTPTAPPTSTAPTGNLTVISPNSVEETYSSLVTFVWRWDAPLMDNFGFEVRLWQDRAESLGIHSSIDDNKNGVIKKQDNNEYSLTIENIASTEPVKRSGSGVYNWTVLLIRLDPYDPNLGIEAASGQVRIGVPGGGNSDSSGSGSPNKGITDVR
ncbi:MAG: serine/threonine protein kinase [Anaerolineae bacterium]|nr:serine/threonine protein kinase [Anaerolineae bacterium]MCB9102148.1 serine/threonine protein kinase [Anaerolineales bacterium]